MAELEHVSSADFDQQVLQSTAPTLVDFTAVWCGPCKMLEPVLKQLADEWKDQVRIVKLDVDQNPDLAAAYTVLSVPTLILFQNGTALERVTGYLPKDRLIKILKPHLQ
ncbi:MAG: thioredoxin [Anaerolineales bacterium]